ncbi:MAG: hypothetical protein R2851_07830 [Caldilineaceae bacterium]
MAATKAAQQEDAEQHLAEAYAILRNRSASWGRRAGTRRGYHCLDGVPAGA